MFKNEIKINPRYMTVIEAADYLGMSKSSLYRMVENRMVPFIPLSPTKVGAAIRRPSLRFDVQALDKWMERKVIKPLPESDF